MNKLPSNFDDRYLTQLEVEALTSRSRSTVNRWAKVGRFPMPLRVRGQSVWLESHLIAWLAGQNVVRAQH
jgi:predicted DNA-binding transcriptional regulator AlpA